MAMGEDEIKILGNDIYFRDIVIAKILPEVPETIKGEFKDNFLVLDNEEKNKIDRIISHFRLCLSDFDDCIDELERFRG